VTLDLIFTVRACQLGACAQRRSQRSGVAEVSRGRFNQKVGSRVVLFPPVLGILEEEGKQVSSIPTQFCSLKYRLTRIENNSL
jgi:hypothetical protein